MKVFMAGGAGAMALGTARELIDKDTLKALILADFDSFMQSLENKDLKIRRIERKL